MKTIIGRILFLILVILVFDLSCKKETCSTGYHLGESFQIKTGKNISLNPVLTDNNNSDSSLTVSFQKVINDSRCYKSQCYLCYGSSASILVQLTNSRINLDISLTIPGCQDEYSCDDNLYYKADTLGYRVCLLRLDPYPDAGVSINPPDYSAKLYISKK